MEKILSENFLKKDYEIISSEDLLPNLHSDE